MRGFFLLGVQRSGTTLLRLLLDAHSDIAIPFESFVLIDFASKIERQYNNLAEIDDRRRLVNDLVSSKGISRWRPSVRIDDINLSKCSNYASTIDQIFSAYAEKCGKSVWGDKTPSYITDFHVLNELFPEAQFIHLIRDGRDVALSIARQPWGPTTFLSALKYWKEVVTWSRKMGCMLPSNRYMEVRFEDLVFNPRCAIQRITTFLNLPFEESILSRYQDELGTKLPVESRTFHANLRRPIDTSLALKWTKTLTYVDQALSYEIVGSLFEELRYPLGCTHAAKGILTFRKLFYWILQRITWRIQRLRRT